GRRIGCKDACESSLPQTLIDCELRRGVFRDRLGYEIHSRQLFQFSRSDETITNILNFTIGNPVPPLEPFDGLVAAPGQKVHGRLRGIVDERLAASHGVQEGNIEAHDAEPDYADFAYFLNHKTGFSREEFDCTGDTTAICQTQCYQWSRLLALT